MGKVILKTGLKREKDKIYYLDANMNVCEAKRGVRAKVKTAVKKK